MSPNSTISRFCLNHKKYFRFDPLEADENAVVVTHFNRQKDNSVHQAEKEIISYSNILAFLDFHKAIPVNDCKLELRVSNE